MGRTKLERILIFIVGLLLVIVFVLAILLGILTTSRKAVEVDPADGVCLSEVCVSASSSVSKAMDRSVEPCQDFYRFACGGWIRENILLPGELIHGALYDIPKKNTAHLMKALESKEATAELSDAEEKAKLFYASCMDATEVTEELGGLPVLRLIESVGGWRLIQNKTDPALLDVRTWNFQDTLAKVHAHFEEEAPYFEIGVMKNVVDIKNAAQNGLWIQPSGLMMEEPAYYSAAPDELIVLLTDYMELVSVMLGAENNDQTKEAMTKVVRFEQNLANLTKSHVTVPDAFFTLAELQEMAPFINWKTYMNERLSSTGYSVNDSELITLLQKRYFEELSKLVKPMLESDEGREILHNYMLWHLVHHHITYLSKDFRKAYETVLGNNGEEAKALKCTEDTDKRLPLATGVLFTRNRLSDDTKYSVESMVKYVTAAFKQNVPKLSWIDAETLKGAIEKVDACEDIIAYPGYIKNKTYMNRVYRDIDIKDDAYFDNLVAVVKSKVHNNLMMLRTTTIPDFISTGDYSLTQVNAGYIVTLNRLMVPAGFIQAPYFTNHFPASLNFGAMGMIIGHELTHGFDTDGRHFDKHGNLRDWWSQASSEKFRNLTECFIKQYSNYSHEGLKVKGDKTVGENIADNGGLQSAFNAYLNFKRDNPPEALLPGLNFTHEQLFFLGFAQAWCTNPSQTYIANQILADNHSPDRDRVLGSLSNSREFSEHFHCTPGQPMNPVHKCAIW